MDCRTAHKHAAFERISGFAADLPGHGGEQIVLRIHGLTAGVHQQKAAGAIGVFEHAFIQAELAEQSSLLVARNAGNGNRPIGEARRGVPVYFAAGFHFGQHGAGNIEKGEQIFVPLQRVDVEKHGAACIAGVGNEGAPFGEVPHEPCVYRAETQFPFFGARTGAGHMV